MTKLFSVNNMNYHGYSWSSTTTSGNTDAMFYAWKAFMISAGWTVIASGDGTGGTLYSSGTKDVFTSSYKGVAGGLGNNKSWFIIQEPGVYAGAQRQFLIFKNNDTSSILNDDYRYIIYSHQGFDLTAGHNNAAISASNPPIAYDEIFIHKTGTWTDNVPSNTFSADITAATTSSNSSTNWNCINNGNLGFTTLYHFYASSTAPYSFYIMVTTTLPALVTWQCPQSSTILRFFSFDELSEYTPNITDPVVISDHSDNNISATYINMSSMNRLYSATCSNTAWEQKRTFTSKADSIAATASYVYTPVSALIMSDTSTVNGTTTSNGAINNPISHKSTVSPILWGYAGYNPWYMGKSSLFNYAHQTYPFPTTFSIASPKDNVTLGYNAAATGTLLIPWNGSSSILTGC
jgi:hypothetical protein